MRRLTGVLVLALLAGCSGSNGASQDERYLRLTAYSDSLSAVDVDTRVQLGHDMCGLLSRYHGDAAKADAAFAAGNEDVFTPALVATLRFDATSAYCPQFRT